MAAILSFAWRAALVAALAGAAAWQGGPIPALVVGALGALALAKPLVELGSDLRHALRAAAWREVQGRHYAFHGRPLRVVEDAEHRRWVRVADLRAIVGFTTSEGALALAYPSGFRRIGADAYLVDDALVLHLAREPGAAALKLRHWVEREILFPARQVRARLGIRVPAPEAPAED